ncbi:hypothetical protein BHE74_00012363 [Ensete ventricosum]|nr:hypothetical protein BHE74_00012363 [Ensete ventricosum]
MVDLTSVVTSGVAESYGESIGAEVWDEGMTRLATLMALENLRLPSSVAHAAAGDPGMGSSKTASEIAEMLDLKPHPEGGFYSETFRDFSITLVKSQLPPHYLDAGHRPQYTVPPNVWFGSFPTLDVASFASDGSLLVKSPKRDPESHYSLVGCTCAPAFQFEDFELAKLADLKPLSPRAEPFLDYLVLPS